MFETTSEPNRRVLAKWFHIPSTHSQVLNATEQDELAPKENLEKIEWVVSSLAFDKAQQTSGFLPSVCKVWWRIIKQDVAKVMTHFFSKSKIAKMEVYFCDTKDWPSRPSHY